MAELEEGARRRSGRTKLNTLHTIIYKLPDYLICREIDVGLREAVVVQWVVVCWGERVFGDDDVESLVTTNKQTHTHL